LPSGASDDEADLDYTGEIMPPPGTDPPLTIDEKMTIARWIDLGCPINAGDGGATEYGWFLDEVRPTLEMSQPRPGGNPTPVATIRIGTADAHGLAAGSLSVSADFPVAGRAPGSELADLATAAGDGIVSIAIDPPLTVEGEQHVYAEVSDLQGNVTRVARRFFVGAAPPPPAPVTCPPSPAAGCVQAGASTLSLRTAPAPKLRWGWRSVDGVAAADLGDPVDATTTFRLCAYDGAGSLLTDVAVHPGRQCGSKPCWQRAGKGGLRYKDGAARQDGVTRLTLRPGEGHRARMTLKARGGDLSAPTLPLAAAEGVTVQLRRDDDTGRCWSATFATALRNTATALKARLD
jgi:hypothetical protein